jgi:hypothetical protein
MVDTPTAGMKRQSYRSCSILFQSSLIGFGSYYYYSHDDDDDDDDNDDDDHGIHCDDCE